MATSRRIHYAGRRVFGAIKRPIFDAAQALSGRRLQATTEYLDFGMYGGAFEAPAQAVQSRLPPGFEEYRDGRVTCTCHHRGVHVLSLRVDARATKPLERRAVFLNVRRDARMIEADFDRSGQLGQGDEPGGMGIELGDDAIADQLRAIGVRLETGRAIYLPHCHGVLHKAVDLGPLTAPPESLRYTAPAVTTPAITEEVRAD